MSNRLEVITATIAASGSLSGVVNIADWKLVGIIMPAAWTAADITFQACDTPDGTFLDVYSDEGTEASITAAASQAISNITGALGNLSPFRYLKLRSGVTATPVAQAAERQIKLIVKR